MDKWLEFYDPYFGNKDELVSFVGACEALDSKVDAAKIMFHQVARLVKIADGMEGQYKAVTPLSLLFLIICAENIAKLHDNFHDEGKSRHYVKLFFNNFLNQTDKESIQHNMMRQLKPLSLEECIDIFYSVRCDVVHEGKYWGFHFKFSDYGIINDQDTEVHLTYPQFRDIVVRGGINAITSKFKNP